MSNNVKLQVLLRAVDRASRPFKSIRTASKSLSGDIRETQKSLRELNGQASRIEGFRKTSAQLAVTGHALEKARQEAEALATQFKNTERPTRAQAKVLESAKRAAEDLQAKYNRLTDSVKRQQRELAAVGINTRNIAHDEQGLKNRISETTVQLNRQRDALARVSAQQAKLNAVKQRYQAGKELAGNMASVGAAGVGIAAAGTMAGVKLLMPCYEFAQKNSELQAVLRWQKTLPKWPRSASRRASSAIIPPPRRMMQQQLKSSWLNQERIKMASGTNTGHFEYVTGKQENDGGKRHFTYWDKIGIRAC